MFTDRPAPGRIRISLGNFCPDAIPQCHALGVFHHEGRRIMAAHMHGGGGTLDRQRQAIIELLEFGNFFAIAYGLAHGSTITPRTGFTTPIRRKLHPWRSDAAGLVMTVKSFSRSTAGA